jgi:hypothetical protein
MSTLNYDLCSCIIFLGKASFALAVEHSLKVLGYKETSQNFVGDEPFGIVDVTIWHLLSELFTSCLTVVLYQGPCTFLPDTMTFTSTKSAKLLAASRRTVVERKI